jgi:glycosyltransferase involved in cell wall biosynthesis
MDGIASVSNKVIERGLQNLLFGAQAFDFYRTFSGLRELAGGLVAAAPVFFAADHFGRQDRQVRRLREQWNAFPLPAAKERLALFSDSLEQVDGVSTWCRRFADHARAAGREVLVPHCSTSLSSELKNDVGWHHLPALTSFSLPLYDCIRLYVPSLIHTLDWAWRERVTHVELSTPGPMGLAGLLVAKILRLPVTASYHTEVPALIGPLGGTGFMEAAARKYLAWFYARVDHVFAVSSQSRETLLRMGVKPEKLSIMPVAVDPNDFSPAHRSPVVFQDLDLDIGDRPVVLSVGRLSEEKNVPLLVEAVERLQARFPAPLLLVVGDGPERSRLEERCREKEFVRLVGPQHGDTLRRLYASARVFVFASRVDTLGLVNMEAMASGVPVLVPSDACIAEFVTHGISAECYEFGAAGLATAIENVLDDRPRAERLAAEGRRVMVDRWKQASFSRIWKSFTQQP